MELSLPLGYAGDAWKAADEDLRERGAAFREAGVTMLNVTPVGPDPARLVETVKGRLHPVSPRMNSRKAFPA